MESFNLSLNGYRLDAEFKNVPIAFVNGIRRILLSEIPTVVIRDVQILDNSTKMIHEMLKHRVEMLPVNVKPDEAAVIRDTRIELRYLQSSAADLKRKTAVEVTTNDFVIQGPRKDIFLKDRDLGEPLFFMNLQPSESIHVKATIAVETRGASQVCVSTFKNHIDPDLAKLDKDTYVAVAGDDENERATRAKIFDNYEIQRSYARDEEGRPYWFDFTVESIGVIPAKDLLKQAAQILKAKVETWCENPILREEGNWFSIETEEDGHTIGALAQSLLYSGGLLKVDFVSYRIVHPLLPKMIVRFSTKTDPEKIIAQFKEQAVALCETILKSV
jgi:DNA-directed RNA polymerase subunit L